jgi:hypothetical protein
MTAIASSPGLDGKLAELAGSFVTWLETGTRPADLFTDDIFADLSVPQWRLQTSGVGDAFQLREGSHPFSGKVRIEALDRTSRGFLIQFEERWNADGQQWYCREMIHCIVRNGRIGELAIYCTGDWDEATQQSHAGQVRLLRT